MNFYDQLQRDTHAEREYFLTSPIITDVLEGRFNLATYIAFLNQAYHHVRHTVPLLMLAGGNLGSHQMYLQDAIAEYIADEKGHEHWILNDIEACGGSRLHYAEGPAPFDSEILVSFLYDTVQRNNPVGIFGMVLVLEGTSADLATPVAGLVQQKLGLPDKAMSYLRSHGTLDQDHIREFEQVINTVNDANDQAAITHVAKTVYKLYGRVYRAIGQEAASIDQAFAA